MIKAIFLTAAGLFGFLSILLSALTAHYYSNRLSIQQLAFFQAAIDFQLFHSIALLALAAFKINSLKLDVLFNIAGCAFIVGIVLFSICIELSNMFNLTHLNILAPIGGVAFMIGWVCIFIAGIKSGFKKSLEQ